MHGFYGSQHQTTTIYSTDASHPVYSFGPVNPPPPPSLQPYSLPFPSRSPSSSPDPSPASLIFDPFADETDSATSSSDSRSDLAAYAPHASENKLGFQGQHERMHRVVAWVDGVNYGHPHGSKAPAPAKNTFYTPSPADTPFVYYSSSPSHSASPSVSTVSSEDNEPYVIYSTPLPGTPAAAAAPQPQASSSSLAPISILPLPPSLPRRHHAPAKSISVPALRSLSRAHRRHLSLSSIREEDESRA